MLMPKNANEKPALAGPRQTYDRDLPTPDQDSPGWPQPAQMEKYFLLFRPAWASQNSSGRPQWDLWLYSGKRLIINLFPLYNQRSHWDRPLLFGFIVEIFLLEGLQTVKSPVSCNLVTFYLLWNDLSRLVLFVQTGSVEVLDFHGVTV